MQSIEKILVDDQEYDIVDASALHISDLRRISPANMKYSVPMGNLIPYYVEETFEGKYPALLNGVLKLNDNVSYTTYKILMPKRASVSKIIRCSATTRAVVENTNGEFTQLASGTSVSSLQLPPETVYLYFGTSKSNTYVFDWDASDTASEDNPLVSVPWLDVSAPVKALTQQNLGNSDLPVAQKVLTQFKSDVDDKLSFVDLGNLFTLEGAKAGYLDTTTGQMIDDGSATYLTSGYIEVDPNQSYAFYIDVNSGKFRFVSEYDESKVHIKTSADVSTFITSKNAAYIRVSIHATSRETATIVEGTEPDPSATYDPKIKSEALPAAYIKSLTKEIFEQGDVTIPLEICDFAEIGNLFILDNVEDGTLGSGGNVVAHASYFTSEYIKVEPNTPYSLHSDVYKKARLLYEFDANKNVVTTHENATTITTDANTAYIRFTIWNTDTGITFVKGDTPDPNASTEPKIKNEVLDAEYIKALAKQVDEQDDLIVSLENCDFAKRDNLFDPSTGEYGYVNNKGSITVDSGGPTTYTTSTYIPVEANQAYAFYRSNNQAWRFVGEYDANKNHIQTLTNVKILTTTTNTAFIRATVHTVDKDTATIVEGEFPNPNAKQGYYIPAKYIGGLDTFTTDLLVFLPDEIVCTVGRTVEIYNTQVCPLAEKYHVRWICRVGKALKRKFSITGTDALVGDYSLVLEIYDDAMNVVYRKELTLKVVSNTLSRTYSICPIGDSLTNSKYWLTEVRTLSGDKISYVGTRGSIEGLKHEGRSGFTAANYLSATEYTYQGEGVHPFWNPTAGRFSWNYYKNSTGINPDAVQIYLGTNDLSNKSAETFVNNIKTIIDYIREDDSTIPIFIVLTICSGNQNGLGVQQSSDGYASQSGRFKYNQDRIIIGGVELLYNTLKTYANVYFIPLTQCHDSEYNFGAVETPVNPRALQTELMPNEGVHPQKQGYEQMADVMYSVYCYAFT